MTLRQRFDSIDRLLLEDWIKARQQEDLHLDFKTIVGDDLSRDDRKNLAKAISGFANSEGGIVVWGVDSRKDESGIDAASELKPLVNARAIFSKFQSLTGESTSPIVDGVEHRLIDDEDGAAFMATLVPASDAGPYMAKLGENRYYKRSGDSFYPLEHFDIADMFGRRPQPLLAVSIQPEVGFRSRSPRGWAAHLAPIILIENRGRGIAKFPYLRLRVSLPYEFGDNVGFAGLPEPRIAQERGWRVFTGGVNDVVHTKTRMAVARLRREVSEHMNELEDLVVEYEVACEGVPPTTNSVRMTGSELLAFTKKAMIK